MQTTIFDLTYYALAGIMTLTLGYTVFLGLKIQRQQSGRNERKHALGMSLTALGAAISVLGGVGFDVLSKNGAIGDLFYQQVHFSIFYAGFALVLYGFETAFSAAREPGLPIGGGRGWGWRIFLWAAYVLSVAVAAAYLFNPATYTITTSGSGQHYAQQRVFFLPLFLTLAVGIVGLSTAAVHSAAGPLRRHLVWLDLFAGLLFTGLLREATLIPSSGVPLVNLLVAFGPFTAGGFCLLVSVRSLRFF